ncbi:hypothetical protein [Flavobacterium aureirubrum]|uniref:hypothetical protein n=1 Tax=Flavobacterium aureirubrum TaxID=3133147 RepID=UPI003182C98F
MDKVLRFIDNNDWADKNGFEKVFVSHEVLQRLFKGKFKTLQELNEASFENDQEKKYLVVTSR